MMGGLAVEARTPMGCLVVAVDKGTAAGRQLTAAGTTIVRLV
jgi:hypothetical protein